MSMQQHNYRKVHCFYILTILKLSCLLVWRHVNIRTLIIMLKYFISIICTFIVGVPLYIYRYLWWVSVIITSGKLVNESMNFLNLKNSCLLVYIIYVCSIIIWFSQIEDPILSLNTLKMGTINTCTLKLNVSYWHIFSIKFESLTGAGI